jgi:hypothetical protein
MDKSFMVDWNEMMRWWCWLLLLGDLFRNECMETCLEMKVKGCLVMIVFVWDGIKTPFV